MLFNNGIATGITIQLHFSTFWGIFCKIWLFLWKNWPEIASVSQRTISVFIHNQKNISSRVMKLGRKLPYRLLFLIHISLFKKHIIRSFHNFQCTERLPLPPNSWIFSDTMQFAFYIGSMKTNNKITYSWFHQLRLWCLIDILEHIW